MNKTIEVLRFEWPDGHGLYTGDWRGEWNDTIWDRAKHPLPMDDSQWAAAYTDSPYYRRHPVLYFGFEDQAQLRAWFYNDAWLRAFADAGVLLCTYEIALPYVVKGFTQLAFEKGRGKRLKRESPLTLLELDNV